MPLKPIDRITLPDTEEFYQKYVYQRRPVVITNMLSDQPIGAIQTLEDADDAFGQARLLVQTEYTARRANPADGKEYVATFREYWDSVRTKPQSKLVCTEYEIPAQIMGLFKLPDICRSRSTAMSEILELPKKYGDHDLMSNVFIAEKGNKAHLHYDGDQRQVLLYQVFGRKEVILFDPSSGADIGPFGLSSHYLGVDLNKMGPEELLEYASKMGGYHTVLYPGEAVYMPMLIWHHLNYTDDAMSFNIRFGRNPYGRFFCVDNFHRDYYMQNFGSLLANENECETVYKEAIDELIKEYLNPTNSLKDKLRSIRSTLKYICNKHCPSARADQFYSASDEASYLGVILEDIGNKIVFASPDQIRRMRPTGGISDSQCHHILDAASNRGYTESMLNHILYNRTGKPNVRSLTKSEANIFMQYLKSPGAWMVTRAAEN